MGLDQLVSINSGFSIVDGGGVAWPQLAIGHADEFILPHRKFHLFWTFWTTDQTYYNVRSPMEDVSLVERVLEIGEGWVVANQMQLIVTDVAAANANVHSVS